jgi:hypothetical protein
VSFLAILDRFVNHSVIRRTYNCRAGRAARCPLFVSQRKTTGISRWRKQSTFYGESTGIARRMKGEEPNIMNDRPARSASPNGVLIGMVSRFDISSAYLQHVHGPAAASSELAEE